MPDQPIDTRLQRILDFLNREEIRATYGSVGEALGETPGRAVGEMLGERRPEASWVVNAETGEPSGYEPSQVHPGHKSRPRILRSGVDLLRCLVGLDPEFSFQSVELCLADLRWSEWAKWNALAAEAQSSEGVTVPAEPGVYEARREGERERLTIGKASDLRMRVKQGLVRGNIPHSSGKEIRAKEELSNVLIRWAVTDRPAAVEEELHRRHRARFGRLPDYVQRT